MWHYARSTAFMLSTFACRTNMRSCKQCTWKLFFSCCNVLGTSTRSGATVYLRRCSVAGTPERARRNTYTFTTSADGFETIVRCGSRKELIIGGEIAIPTKVRHLERVRVVSRRVSEHATLDRSRTRTKSITVADSLRFMCTAIMACALVFVGGKQNGKPTKDLCTRLYNITCACVHKWRKRIDRWPCTETN